MLCLKQWRMDLENRIKDGNGLCVNIGHSLYYRAIEHWFVFELKTGEKNGVSRSIKIYQISSE